jgi:putative nucleotidyltransferase with HDIG domain
MAQGELEKQLKEAIHELSFSYEELALLYHISEQIGLGLSIDEICEHIAKDVLKTLQVKNVAVFLVDELTKEIVLRAFEGKDKDRVSELRLHKEEGITGTIISRGKPVIIEDIRKVPRSLRETTYPMTKLLGVPMLVKNKVIGAIIASDKLSGELFNSYDLKLVMAVATQAAIAIENSRLHQRLNELFMSTVEALVSAIDQKSPWTAGHSHRVTEIAKAIGQELGLDRESLRKLKIASLLHDIGKLGIPERVLDQPGRLEESMFANVKDHPVKGANILKHIKPLADIIPAIKHHHERYDGKGYPDGLADDEIPLAARIISVADAFDAMTTDRPYRKAMSTEKAAFQLLVDKNKQWDEKIVKALLKSINYQKAA